MRSWPAPQLPRLPGSGRTLRVFDTATGSLRLAAPGGTGRMYVCGITPYDATHLGHAATYLAFDLVQRVWRDAGLRVHYVQNVTDVDDPLLERAHQIGDRLGGLGPSGDRALSRRHDRAASPAARRVRGRGREHPRDREGGAPSCSTTEPPTTWTRTSISPLQLLAGSATSRTTRRDRCSRYPPSAAETRSTPRQARPARRLVVARPRVRRTVWDTDLGPGRPGWHIECAVIALNRLGEWPSTCRAAAPI